MKMSAAILDGKKLAATTRTRLKAEIAKWHQVSGRAPHLSVVLVGEDPASAVYVRNKQKAAAEVGIESQLVRLPDSADESTVLKAVQDLNNDESVDAFLVQLPLPASIDELRVTAAIAPEKDADGLHPENLGQLLVGGAAPRPCTPSGCMALLDDAGIELKGKTAVVVGRSAIVGKPMALMLLERHATVTICHSRTADLNEVVARADVVVAAVGRPRFIPGDWIKPGAAVVDVGINRLPPATEGGKGKLVGDVDFDSAVAVAGHITPVPGGVGPMTVAMLLQNAFLAAKRREVGNPRQ